ncbi:hypothetical protein KF913_08625 [Candidatus Obscuribacterales bacterium]|nr:hypothetical protein [Candidatus Obscuribacterales bacterium]
MKKQSRRRVAEEAALFMATGLDAEYLHAKERAVMMLGISSSARMPSNRVIKEFIGLFTKAELGEEEHTKRLREMREIAVEVMEAIQHFDPFLIGSTLSGKIRLTSDIDFHAYADHFEEIKDALEDWGFEDVEEELVENIKGSFVHLKWLERNYPVEITVYPWSSRDAVPYSSVTRKPMKRMDLPGVRELSGNCRKL